jgi:hypothetical protein
MARRKSKPKPQPLPEPFDALEQFVAAYTGIMGLLDAVLADGPPLPGWKEYDPHLAALDKHRPTVAALMARHQVSPDAGALVAGIVQSCTAAKLEFERAVWRSYAPERFDPPDRLGDVREAVARWHNPICQLLEIMKMEVRERAGKCRDENTKKEWLPASAAVERAEKAGYSINLSWLTRDAAKHGIRTRPRQLEGRHRSEVEWDSLAGYLMKQKAKPDEESEEEAVSERLREAQERKQKERPLD